MFEKFEESERVTTICPECGKPAVVPIRYGYPGLEMAEAARRKEIIIGGCIVGPGKPRRGCTCCGWREPAKFNFPGIRRSHDASAVVETD